ncbi:MAG: Hsp20/alpha crystallin family protein, partial [Armatimonadetes bacterium]|nr:Hsp20/alpha crystallin family protein [Armatimonadota bacterium]
SNEPDATVESLRLERFRGPFRRIVPLPRQANSAEIRATLERGVLTLEVLKTLSAGGRRIEIG